MNTDDANRTRPLISHPAHRSDILLQPVLVPAGTDAPLIHPFTVLLPTQIARVTTERDALRDRVTTDPATPRAEQPLSEAADKTGHTARRASP